jgi:hypothetical protein
MAQQLQNITLGAPGFFGLNTELSPVQLPPQFCTAADNCVIDNYGRLGARKGFKQLTTSGLSALGGLPLKRVFEGSVDGTNVLFGAGNGKLFVATTTVSTNDTLTELTLPIGYTITADNWDFVDFNGEAFFFQAGHPPLLANAASLATDSVVTLDSESLEAVPAAPEADCVIAAFGRLWASGDPAFPDSVNWSDTLIGDGWTQGASGAIDVNTVWPRGSDVVTGLAVHNGRLIIFGRNSIIIYSGAEDPTTMALEDVIIGAGCVARDSIQNTGDDIIFLSASGMKMLSRTISETSLPIGDMTQHVRTQIIQDVASETGGISSVYSPEQGFALLILEAQQYIYCMDFKHHGEELSHRITVWPGSAINCAWRADDGTLLLGGTLGIGKYDGYLDGTNSYRWQYYSPSLTFDTPANLKFPKRIRPIIIGASGGTATVSWGFGYANTFNTEVVPIEGSGAVSEYNISEYNIGEYSNTLSVSDVPLNASGSGSEVKLGVGTTINGSPFSLQQINIQALIGRLI